VVCRCGEELTLAVRSPAFEFAQSLSPAHCANNAALVRVPGGMRRTSPLMRRAAKSSHFF
jgi:hypothetical protein